MLSKEEIEANELVMKIYRVQENILDEIRRDGEVSYFKEDVLHIIHYLLEKPLTKEEKTACEMVLKQQDAFFQHKKEEQLKNKIDQLKSEKQNLIEKLEKDIVNITKYYNSTPRYDYYKRCRLKAYRTKTREILTILKGENHEQ